MEGNQLLEGAVDRNDAIREHNFQVRQKLSDDLSKQDDKDEAIDIYHGVGDALGTQHTISAVANQYVRAKQAGKSFTELAKSDINEFGTAANNFTRQSAESLSQGINNAKNTVGNVVSKFSTPSRPPTSFIRQPIHTLTPTQANTTSLSTSDDISSSTPEADAGTAGGAVEDAGKTGGFTENLIARVTGKEVGTLANAGIGKVLGNVGGAIDIVKDFDNIDGKGGFFGGSGDSSVDETANKLTVAGTILDVSSLALPFLAPAAALVSAAGAVTGTAAAISDDAKDRANTTAQYQGKVEDTVSAPSLAGTGFLSGVARDPEYLVHQNTVSSF
jgi:hypothetical protein